MSKSEWSTKLEPELIQEIDNYIELRYGSISKGNRKRFLLEAFVKLSGAEVQIENDKGELVTVKPAKPVDLESYTLVENKVKAIIAFNQAQQTANERLLINGALLALLFTEGDKALHQKARRDYLKVNDKEITQHHEAMGLGNAKQSHNSMNLLAVTKEEKKDLSPSAVSLVKVQRVEDVKRAIEAYE